MSNYTKKHLRKKFAALWDSWDGMNTDLGELENREERLRRTIAGIESAHRVNDATFMSMIHRREERLNALEHTVANLTDIVTDLLAQVQPAGTKDEQ